MKHCVLSSALHPLRQEFMVAGISSVASSSLGLAITAVLPSLLNKMKALVQDWQEITVKAHTGSSEYLGAYVFFHTRAVIPIPRRYTALSCEESIENYKGTMQFSSASDK